jgi:hypothetical protein
MGTNPGHYWSPLKRSESAPACRVCFASVTQPANDRSRSCCWHTPMAGCTRVTRRVSTRMFLR